MLYTYPLGLAAGFPEFVTHGGISVCEFLDGKVFSITSPTRISFCVPVSNSFDTRLHTHEKNRVWFSGAVRYGVGDALFCYYLELNLHFHLFVGFDESLVAAKLLDGFGDKDDFAIYSVA